MAVDCKYFMVKSQQSILAVYEGIVYLGSFKLRGVRIFSSFHISGFIFALL